MTKTTVRLVVGLLGFLIASASRSAEAPHFFIGEWTHLGSAIGQYHQGIKVCTDGKGSLYVLAHGGAVLRFTVGGRFVHSWQAQGQPLAMDIDPDGRVVLLRAGWIDRYDPLGNLVSSAELVPAPDLGTQSDMAIDPVGNVLLLERWGWVSVYGYSGGRAARWLGPLNVHGIAVSARFDVYLVGDVGPRWSSSPPPPSRSGCSRPRPSPCATTPFTAPPRGTTPSPACSTATASRRDRPTSQGARSRPAGSSPVSPR